MAFPRISRLFRRAPSNRINKVGLLRKQSLPLRMVNLEERVTPAISITSLGSTITEEPNHAHD